MPLDTSTALRADRAGPDDLALRMLRAGMPLTLLLDLARPVPSADLYSQERGDAGWVGLRRLS